MKHLVIFLLLLLPFSIWAQNVDFNEFFEDRTLRMDYYHSGDAKNEQILPDKMYLEGAWAGNPENCIQPYELGSYKINVIDVQSDRLIFSRGYNSIFTEYQTIEAAVKGIKKVYHESILIPFPKNHFNLIIEKRDRYNQLSQVYNAVIDPDDYHIINQKSGLKSNTIIPFVVNGEPHNKVDMVILAEGYQENEIHKFKIDLENYGRLFFSVEPYKSRAGQFNLYGIFSASEESGTDEPRQRIYKNTRFGSSFNYFDLDHYCLADDNKSIRDVAASVPYDVIVIMVNRERYGGGGIYNMQTLFTVGTERSGYVFLHEFGHGFAGLADEYFSSPVTYVDFNTKGVEPLEANITTLPDPSNVKWKQFLSPDIKVPTDWDKEKFDSLEALRSAIYLNGEKVISDLHKSGAPYEKLNEARNELWKKVERINQDISDFFNNHPLKDKVGVFEGANYLGEGMYRSVIMSIMHDYDDDMSYGTVNENAIVNTIRYYCGE